MEKLQAALQKAKKDRAEQAGKERSPQQADMPRADIASSGRGVDSLWQSLKTFDVSKEHLIERRVVTREAGPVAAPFDILRTKVLLLMRQNGWKRLAITSPMPASGKTTIACNLSLGLGRQEDLRTILMDLDLRDPSINEFFQTEPDHGIGEMLAGRVDFAEHAMRIGSNVCCSMAKVNETDPTRLLLSEITEKKIDDIQAAYQPDLMIFDLPSVLVNDDTRAFLKNVDCALIVARCNSTKYGQLDRCEREIAALTNVLGIVLNAYGTTNTQKDNEDILT
ncbi:MAG: CpsD/CapB family tyrosine-protein kinase [Tateyamaria sp.]|uniref:CpsD/CapB family tyrosine-protein kinase n=1 Tax=Tateyamaria sp. TaxID=1929288 RepID=UPI00329C4BFD